MNKDMEQVKEFHKTYEVEINNKPIVNPSDAMLRVYLLEEEVSELKRAIVDKDLVEIADALTDIQYVLNGAYLTFGFAGIKQEMLDEVHRSNMSKLDINRKPIFREDKKVLKGPNYSPPNLLPIIEKFNERTDI